MVQRRRVLTVIPSLLFLCCCDGKKEQSWYQHVHSSSPSSPYPKQVYPSPRSTMVVKVAEYHVHDGSDSTALSPQTVPQKVSDQKSDSKSNQIPDSPTQTNAKERIEIKEKKGKKPKRK